MGVSSWVLSGGTAIQPTELSSQDVAIADGLFADGIDPSARRYDASGLVLAPGIIDVHGTGYLSQFAGVLWSVTKNTSRGAAVSGVRPSALL